MFNAFVATYILLMFNVSPYIAALLRMLSAFIVGIVVDIVVISRTQNMDPVSKQIITLALFNGFSRPCTYAIWNEPNPISKICLWKL